MTLRSTALFSFHQLLIVQQLSLFDPSLPLSSPIPKSKPTDENYTPTDLMGLVHQFYGFPSLDPFSCEFANQFVKAEKYFTKEDNAFHQNWRGYPTIWMNPPYSVGFLEPVVDKMIDLLSVESPEILLLTNTDHSTKWYKKALRKCGRFALSEIRLPFYSPSREAEGKKNNNNSKPQTLFYYGQNPKKFKEIFDVRENLNGFGIVCRTD